MKLIRKKQSSEKIEKSKEIIKKEKQKIKIEKRKQKKEKLKKNKFINKFFKIEPKENEVLSTKEQVLSMIYFEIIGALICLLILFALSGGKNYFRLYSELSKLIDVYSTIESNYYGELDKEKLVDAAVEAMIDSVGDAYTKYTNDEDGSSYLDELEGTYEGIGCTVSTNKDNQIVVVSLFEDSPAKKAGLLENDIIIKIDNQDFTDKTSDDMANYVKSTLNSEIKLTIIRNEEEKEITIKREKIEVPSVTSSVIENDDKLIGYMDISIFSAVTYNQFKEQLEELEKQNIEGLIIDVRNDTGGYLSAVTDITNLFLKKGQVIYQLENDKTTEKIKDTTKEHREYPVAVLINAASASASEILASAIKESYGGIVLGTNSYGKGTVQKTKTLSDGSLIKYTTQKWLTPNGNWINEVGVEPTHVIAYDIIDGKDIQIESAVSEIIKKSN